MESVRPLYDTLLWSSSETNDIYSHETHARPPRHSQSEQIFDIHLECSMCARLASKKSLPIDYEWFSFRFRCVLLCSHEWQVWTETISTSPTYDTFVLMLIIIIIIPLTKKIHSRTHSHTCVWHVHDANCIHHVCNYFRITFALSIPWRFAPRVSDSLHASSSQHKPTLVEAAG